MIYTMRENYISQIHTYTTEENLIKNLIKIFLLTCGDKKFCELSWRLSFC